jgi:hypothetical protein
VASEPSSAPTRYVPFFIFLGLTGLAARIILSWFSYGTNDVTTWLRFAQSITDSGIVNLYHSDRLFNHPPLAGYLVTGLALLAEQTGIAAPFLLRLPGILCELLTALILWRVWSERKDLARAGAAVAGFGLSLISILISGYHGNTDCIYAFLIFASVYLLEARGAALLSGIALGCATNVKIIPLLLLVPIISRCKTRGSVMKFSAGFAVMLLPLLFAYLAVGGDFIRNVFGYNSQLDYWGLELFLLLGRFNAPNLAGTFDAIMNFHQSIGRYLILASIIMLTAYNMKAKRWDGYELCALSFCLFAILAPGFAGQYFVILPALLFCFSQTWGIRLSTWCGIVALASYASFLVSLSPLQSLHTATSPKPVIFLSFIAWTALLVFFIERLANRAIIPHSR